MHFKRLSKFLENMKRLKMNGAVFWYAYEYNTPITAHGKSPPKNSVGIFIYVELLTKRAVQEEPDFV